MTPPVRPKIVAAPEYSPKRLSGSDSGIAEVEVAPGGNRAIVIVRINDPDHGDVFDLTMIISANGRPMAPYKLPPMQARYLNADLTELAITPPGTPPLAFDPAITSYTVNQSGTVEQVSITTNHFGLNSSRTKSGTNYPPGRSSVTVALTENSSTVVPIVVTADSGRTKTYTLTVTRGAVVDAQTPVISVHPQNATYDFGATATALSVTASVTDGGTLTYQWFSSPNNSNWTSLGPATATATSHTPATSAAGTVYYRVEVTNTNIAVNGNPIAVNISNAATVTVAAPPVVTVTAGSSTTPHPTISAALASITSAGNYTVTLYQNQSLAATYTVPAGTTITLIGDGQMRTITRISVGRMFTVTGSGRELILESNITLDGREVINNSDILSTDDPTHPSNPGCLVFVQNGAAFTMQGNSVVTRNHYAAESILSAVIAETGAVFTMKGTASITGNSSGTGTLFVAPSGLLLRSGATAVLEDNSSITGNTQGANRRIRDVFLRFDTHITLSGNATIGELGLSSDGLNSTVGIRSGWAGNIIGLFLHGSAENSTDIIQQWLGRQVLEGAGGYSITQADINRVTLREFIHDGPNANSPIPPRTIGPTGVLQ